MFAILLYFWFLCWKRKVVFVYVLEIRGLACCCVEFWMLVLYMNDFKNNSKLNMRKQRLVEKQDAFRISVYVHRLPTCKGSHILIRLKVDVRSPNIATNHESSIELSALVPKSTMKPIKWRTILVGMGRNMCATQIMVNLPAINWFSCMRCEKRHVKNLIVEWRNLLMFFTCSCWHLTFNIT